MSDDAESIMRRMKEPAFIKEKDALAGDIKEAHRLAGVGLHDESVSILKGLIRKHQQSEFHDLIRRGIETEIARILGAKASEIAEQGKNQEARVIFDEAMKYLEESFDEDDRWYIISYAAGNLMCLGEYEQSLEMYLEVSQRQQQRHGPNHRTVLGSKSNVAKAIDFLGDYETSLTIFGEILPEMKKSLGPDDHATLAAQTNMAMTLLKVQKYQEAYDNLKEVCEIREKVHGPDHNQTLAVRGNLVRALHKLNKFDEALDVVRDVVEKRTKLIGPDHPSIIALENEMATILKDQCKHLEAIKVWNQILEKQRRLHGEDSSNAKTTIERLDNLKQELGHEKYQELIKQL